MDSALFQDNSRQMPVTEARQLLSVGSFTTENGAEIEDCVIAYETWGELNAAKDNAVLVCHAISGDSHAVGWWDRIVGPGKAVDTDKYFVICSNALGGCQGTTGPASLDREGRRLGSRFPQISVGDMVELQRHLIDHLGIQQLRMTCGGSMGGMQALEWSLRFPDRVKKCWMTASTRTHSAMQIAFNEAARQAILRDPGYQNGDYTEDTGPVHGLVVARIVGHLSYLSDAAFQNKFGRNRQNESQFSVESYLSYQGEKFTKRFDAQSLVVLSRAIDAYEATSLDSAQCEYLFTSYKSDWIYPPHQSEELYSLAQAAGKKCRYVDIDLPYGHDAFLLDGELQGKEVTEFLAS